MILAKFEVYQVDLCHTLNGCIAILAKNNYDIFLPFNSFVSNFSLNFPLCVPFFLENEFYKDFEVVCEKNEELLTPVSFLELFIFIQNRYFHFHFFLQKKLKT